MNFMKMMQDSFGSNFNFSREVDALFFNANSSRIFGVAGLPFSAPVAMRLLNDPDIYEYSMSLSGHVLLVFNDNIIVHTAKGVFEMPVLLAAKAHSIFNRVISGCGNIDENGRHIIDLKSEVVGPHYNVNLLLGDRTGYDYPLFTTPKSALDMLGRGSFRSGGGQQVLATRYVVNPNENGEPANRQFYIIEKGRQIFYSANVNDNVQSAECVHMQNCTEITYHTICGLHITRTFFILPQKQGNPAAVEVQRIAVKNLAPGKRDLKIVLTGVFGICSPQTIVNDVIYANIVHQSELVYQNDKPVAFALHNKDEKLKGEKKFVTLTVNGRPGFDDYCAGLSDFLGNGTLERPETLAVLPSKSAWKITPFFAIGKYFTVDSGETANINSYTGICENPAAGEGYDVTWDFDVQLNNLLSRYGSEKELDAVLERVINDFDKYSSYLTLSSKNSHFDSYVGKNLPFQVLYQTFVSRSFGWTQKAYRETGFREIQDIYASMNYLLAAGKAAQVKDLISMWINNVFEMGYAYHDFTWRGKDPGGCSDDQLWLVQAVYRYVKMTGDYSFLNEEFSVAGKNCPEKRSLWLTLKAILTYSGRISVGAQGLPLLDRADWNDTLRLDKTVLNGPEKEKAYHAQLETKKQSYGVRWENRLTESVMNACLLKIAADEIAEIADAAGRTDIKTLAREISAEVHESVRKNCWKKDYYARTLINDGRDGGYTYLGAGGDNLSADADIDGTYYLNSFSWTILSGIADENQIRTMLDSVERHLKVDAGLKLCTLVNYNLLGTDTATNLYYPGDRENGGVFKHAAMMAATAALSAAKTVENEVLARRLVALAKFAIDKVLPYKTLEQPFITKGNPRFCTQYNNSVTGENIGPILSGTASWLTLAVYEMLGIEETAEYVSVNPVLFEDDKTVEYTLLTAGGKVSVNIKRDDEGFRINNNSKILVDGKPVDRAKVLKDGREHLIEIVL